MSISGNISNFLFKKTFGVVNTKPGNSDLFPEGPGNSLPKVFSKQIYSQIVPEISPTCPQTYNSISLNSNNKVSTNPDLVFTGYINNLGQITQTQSDNFGLLFTSIVYPHIQYIDSLKLTFTASGGIAYCFSNPTSSAINLLQDAIPTNYDISSNQTYQINVKTSSGTFFDGQNQVSTIPMSEYFVDKDAGYLYFINSKWTSSFLSDPSSSPLISFYRYNGTFGVQSGGTTSGGTGSFQSLTGGTGSFQSLSAVTGSFQSLTGGTGSFQSLTGGTGSFQTLSAQTVTVNTRTFQTHQLVLSGQEFYQANNIGGGVSINCGVNRGGNKQLWIMDPDPSNLVDKCISINANVGVISCIKKSDTSPVPLGTNSCFYIERSTGVPTIGQFGGNGDRIILYQGSTTDTPYSIGINSGTLWYAAPTNCWHRFYGSVGIGTDPVNSALHISGSVLRMGTIYEQANTTFPEQIQWGIIDNRGYANITAGLNNIFGPDGVGGTLSLVTKLGNTTAASGIFINNGNVEIGTPLILSPLTVNGSTFLKHSLFITNSSLDRYNSLVIETLRAGIMLRSPSGSGGKAWNIWSSITSGCPYGGGAFTIFDESAGAFRFVINSSGQVIIPSGVTGGTGSFQSLILDSTGIYLGQYAGKTGSVNIGYQAGQYNSSNYSVNIGYKAGPTGNNKNNIILNASGVPLYPTENKSGFYVDPVSYSSSTGTFDFLIYGDNKQIVRANSLNIVNSKFINIYTSSSINFNSIASSSNGKYIIASTNNIGSTNILYLSSNYGISFSNINYFNFSIYTNNINSVSMSSSGQYIAISTNRGVDTSSDYGLTFQSRYSAGEIGPRQGVKISSDGKYIICIYAVLTFTGDNSVGNQTYNFNSNAASISSSGQYIVAIENQFSQNLWLSSNYGSSFNKILDLGIVSSVVSMSSSGQYIVVGRSPTPIYGNVGGLYISSNYGSSFSLYFSTYNIVSVSISPSGQYIMFSRDQPGVFYSSDFGLNFSLLNETSSKRWSYVYSSDLYNFIIPDSIDGSGIYSNPTYSYELSSDTILSKNLSAVTGSFQSLTGGTGSFQSLSAVTGSFQSLTGGTGSFQTISAGSVRINVAGGGSASDQLIIGDNIDGSHLRLGVHVDYSWIQSFGQKPLWLNSLGNEVHIGNIAKFTNNNAGNDCLFFGRTTNNPNILWGPDIIENNVIGQASYNGAFCSDALTTDLCIRNYGKNIRLGTNGGNASNLTIQSNGSTKLYARLGVTHQLVLAGRQFYAPGGQDSYTGVSLNVGVNGGNNKQLWIMDPDLASNTTNKCIRINPNSGTIDCIRTDGDNTLPLGTNNLFYIDRSTVGTPTIGQFGGNGDKIILWKGDSTYTPYSIGINSGTLWYSVPTNSWHRFYGPVGIDTDPGAYSLCVNGSASATTLVINGLNTITEIATNKVKSSSGTLLTLTNNSIEFKVDSDRFKFFDILDIRAFISSPSRIQYNVPTGYDHSFSVNNTQLFSLTSSGNVIINNEVHIGNASVTHSVIRGQGSGGLILDASSNAVYLSTNGVLRYYANEGSFSPQNNNTCALGWSNTRWSVVYATNGTIQTSDSSLKNAEPLQYGLNEVMQMNTIKFKWKSQTSLPDDDPTKNYEYYGFCADELASVFPELVYDEQENTPVQMNYTEIMPVLVNAIKELKHKNDRIILGASTYFTGQHAIQPLDTNLKTNIEDYVGLIVSSADEGYYSINPITKQILTGVNAIQITETLPYIKLTIKDKDKAVWGVLTNVKNDTINTDGTIPLDNTTEWADRLETMVRVNGLGEGAVWVTNINGNIENGDLICSSIIPGYGRLQDDDLFHNYTVAKATMSCNFDLLNDNMYKCKNVTFNDTTYIAAFIGCTYHCS